MSLASHSMSKSIIFPQNGLKEWHAQHSGLSASAPGPSLEQAVERGQGAREVPTQLSADAAFDSLTVAAKNKPNPAVRKKHCLNSWLADRLLDSHSAALLLTAPIYSGRDPAHNPAGNGTLPNTRTPKVLYRQVQRNVTNSPTVAKVHGAVSSQLLQCSLALPKTVLHNTQMTVLQLAASHHPVQFCLDPWIWEVPCPALALTGTSAWTPYPTKAPWTMPVWPHQPAFGVMFTTATTFW